VLRPDGLTILGCQSQSRIRNSPKSKQVRFDVRKFQWLGSSGADGVMLSIRSDLPFKSFDELRKRKELVAGTTGPVLTPMTFLYAQESPVSS